ncbi:MAG: ABC transporter ATP-binding protein [Deltaproteobacteria bacterium]|nr:ABC transporter ATP-binding protein [Deltaproteobacteria bacterium]
MIQISSLYKSFHGQPVLNGVTLEVPQGGITVILGASGQGKTVLLKHIIGHHRPDRGKVLVDGVDINLLNEREKNEFRKRFGMLYQGAALFDSMTVGENVAFPLREHTKLSEREITLKVGGFLEMVGLNGIEAKMPSELSGGMRKRVGLARAIALQPKIILYDEPTTGLDPITTTQINRLVLEMQKKLRITSVIISHDIESTFAVADQVAMLHEGKIIEVAPPELFRSSRHPFVKQFLAKEPV